MAIEREKIYECEVKRRRVKEAEAMSRSGGEAGRRSSGRYDTEFRCQKTVTAAVKLLGRNGKTGTVPYVEHKVIG